MCFVPRPVYHGQLLRKWSSISCMPLASTPCHYSLFTVSKRDFSRLWLWSLRNTEYDTCFELFALSCARRKNWWFIRMWSEWMNKFLKFDIPIFLENYIKAGFHGWVQNKRFLQQQGIHRSINEIMLMILWYGRKRRNCGKLEDKFSLIMICLIIKMDFIPLRLIPFDWLIFLSITRRNLCLYLRF